MAQRQNVKNEAIKVVEVNIAGYCNNLETGKARLQPDTEARTVKKMMKPGFKPTQKENDPSF